MWTVLIPVLAGLAHAAPQTTPTRGPGDFSLIRFGCSQVVIDRIDPLVNPGVNPSPHVHQVVGGNAFNVSIPSTDVSDLASCTTCTFAEDLSNYWTANIYFKARNGSYKRVPQMPNRFFDGEQGGMTVYYVAPGAHKVTAFKPGFRMLVGDSMRRTRLGAGRKSQSCFRCFSGPDFKGDDASPCADPKLDTETFPAGPCLGGIRSNIHFPTCWDGKNLDSPTHQDHVAYPVSGPSSFATTGTCPASHPVKIPQLMLEIVWDTTGFNDKSLWPEDGSQPLVLSTGDNTGYGQHGDYVFGWKGDALQRAMDGSCFGAECGTLKVQAFAAANKCSVETRVNENTEGWFSKLPGDGSGA
ncbi:hypothetical protein B0T22DRAFT_426911 [Podospora appendiculata]|uniref:DUF1996 domain-containing protein n=1 Tax=Podospora appendiculata TaxID=314037 RepID=A0AAE0XA53_9PEZI|nr:hypothetical protein B0T22DRAFT_426911 [Podospora appendiculata]